MIFDYNGINIMNINNLIDASIVRIFKELIELKIKLDRKVKIK
jgi:hypothetical protein